jgi:signal transduction histidine kinase
VRGETVGRVWSFRDITEARQADLVKGRFLDMATHEMRNPLGVVSALAWAMLEDWPSVDEDTKREYVRRIHVQADRLGRLVEDLLLTSRVEGGKLDPRPRPMELIDAVRRLLRELEREDVDVHAATPVVAIADPDYFLHMLSNYMNNADKYGRPPVWVEVDARDGSAEVRVADSGDGVPPELATHLFERFSPAREALNPAAPGSGLGLWIVRELARAQGGDAWYDGTRFCFRLPLAEGA